MLFNLRDDPHELVNLVDAESTAARRLEDEQRAICDPEAVSDRAHQLEDQQFRALMDLQKGDDRE